MTRALDDIRVLDFTRVVAGPACTASLCAMGADVLKIEPPEGDLMRRARPRRDGIALYWAQVNCGKRCLCLDLARPEAQQVARELAGHSDVVVENFRPGVMARMGLGPEQLRERRPDLVYCSISGYGQTGPAAQRRAYAPVIHAELGLLELGTHRGTEPLPEPVSHADFAVAAQATSAILAALFHRQRSGEGQHVDVSMAETMLAVMEWTAIEANGGMGSQLPTFYPAKAVIVRLGDGSHVALPGFPASAFPPGARSRRWPTCPGRTGPRPGAPSPRWTTARAAPCCCRTRRCASPGSRSGCGDGRPARASTTGRCWASCWVATTPPSTGWRPGACWCSARERLPSAPVVTRQMCGVRRRARRALAAVAGLTLAASMVACGQDSDPLEQPHLGGERFTRITFDGLPRPANGTQIAYLTTELNQQEQLEIPDASADDVLEWYDDQLADQGWNRTTGPEETREGTLVTYERMGRTVALLATNEEPANPGEPSPALVTVSFNKLSRPGTKQEAPSAVIQTTTTQS